MRSNQSIHGTWTTFLTLRPGTDRPGTRQKKRPAWTNHVTEWYDTFQVSERFSTRKERCGTGGAFFRSLCLPWVHGPRVRTNRISWHLTIIRNITLWQWVASRPYPAPIRRAWITELVLIGMVVLIIFMVAGYFVSSYFKRRRFQKRQKQRLKEKTRQGM